MRATITCAQLESRLLARRNKNIAVIGRIPLWLVNMNRVIIQRITASLMLPDSRELFFHSEMEWVLLSNLCFCN